MMERSWALEHIPESEVLMGYQSGEVLPVARECPPLNFEEIFQQFRQKIYQLAYRILGNQEDALDLTQDIFITVYYKMSGFRGDSSLKTWLYRITINKALNKIRWSKARRQNQTDSFQAMPPSTLQTINLKLSSSIRTPEQSMQGMEIEENFQRALNRLRPKYRFVLVMRDVQGLSYDEIASTLGISLGTVKSRISRAREDLRELLERFVKPGEKL